MFETDVHMLCVVPDELTPLELQLLSVKLHETHNTTITHTPPPVITFHIH